MLLRTRRTRPARLPAAIVALAVLFVAAPACRRAAVPEATAASGGAAARSAAQDVPDVVLSATVEPAAVAPGGTVTVAWRLAATPGWHFYWDGRNDSGFAPRQKLFLPDGWTAGPLQWPVPERLVSPGDILDHVYHDEVVLLQQVTAPPRAAAGRLALRSDWQWLTCRDVCVPGRESLAVDVTVDPAAPAPAPSPALAAARARLPQPLPAGLLAMRWDGAALHLQGTGALAGGRLTFMPFVDCADLADLLNDGEGTGNDLVLHLAPDARGSARVRGLLLVQEGAAAPRAYTIDVPRDVPRNTPDPHSTGGRP